MSSTLQFSVTEELELKSGQCSEAGRVRHPRWFRGQRDLTKEITIFNITK